MFATGRDAADGWSHPQIYLSRPDAEPVNLTRDASYNSWPAVAADGRTMAFVSARRGGPGLYVMDLDSGESRELATGPGSVMCPRWSPAHELAYNAPASAPGTSVWIIDPRSGEPRRITEPGSQHADDAGVAFIDQGRRVVFSRYDRRSQDRDLYVVDADGSHLQRLTATSRVSETLPVTSHDGRWLAYRATHSGLGDTIDLVATADWSLVRQIELPSPVKWNVSGLDFLAGDGALVFGADADDVGGSLQNIKGEVFAVDVDGTHLRRFTNNAAYDGEPAALP